MLSEILLKELVKPIVCSISAFIKDESQKAEYISNMCNLLSANYKSRSVIKNILHSSGPVRFKDIYCPLKMKKLTMNGFEWSESSLNVSSTSELMDAFNNVAIFGNAGSGKSTLVNFLYLDAIEKQYKYPILIYLRYLNETSDSLIDVLKRQTLGYKKEPSDDLFIKLLEEGHFLFIFDGYDEVTPAKQYGISMQIKELMSNYPSNKYVLTSRPLEHLYSFGSFHNYMIAPLTGEERNVFIRKQFPEDGQKIAEIIIRKLSDSSNIQYSQLLNTPLLIILCILNFRFYSDLPPKKNEFYARIFDSLFQGHDWLSKTGFERVRKSGLTRENYISILNRFSYYTHFKSQYYFTKQDVLNVFDLINLEKLTGKVTKYFNKSDLFDDLTVAINILVLDGIYYTFPHKSFQEYYVANYIANKNENARIKFYSRCVDKFCNDDAALLTQPMLSMLYEMDAKFFIDYLFLPLLKRIKENITVGRISSLNGPKLAHILSMINVIFYGHDEYGCIRNEITIGIMKKHIDEIDKLIVDIENSQRMMDDDDDDFMLEL